MQDYFLSLAAHIETQLAANEVSTTWLSAESSDFVRFNRSAIRQPGHVLQLILNLQLIKGQTHAAMSFNLSGETEMDLPRINAAIEDLRTQLPDLPADPHLMIATEVNNSVQILPSSLPPTSAILEQILAAANGVDMVGLLTTGTQYRGFANSYGQRNWYETSNINFDWSLFHSTDKAVKSNYAGFHWDEAEFLKKFADARQKLALLARPPVTVAAGNYRAYLSPTALNELIMMLNWGGLSEKSLRTRHSCLRRLQSGEASMHAMVDICEDSRAGLEPGFQAQGFIKPDVIPLIQTGKLSGSMISPRSAKEFGLIANGAPDDESARSLIMRAGTLANADILKELGTGIYISNLWYLNFSDRATCRITGMTRFATFWVENGEIKAPLNVMRFDDSLFRILGDNLLKLTQETEVIMDDRSYGERHTGGAVVPGALLKEMYFAL
ncbi:metallopeptidase TldD-related protein [Undibacterium umbellatum]|uniref:TldE/PmbA family protein n=1 Tax=Undibacterium umbellatum TaxID=2762300 RepID=A0ABR6ZAQ3_9BURK|nr:metallopeptidase TldD-related protein [Undibacterium umbellatum]MBC3908714.1 TldE/PmbA family protein [Undibacterium umbellatum]